MQNHVKYIIRTSLFVMFIKMNLKLLLCSGEYLRRTNLPPNMTQLRREAKVNMEEGGGLVEVAEVAEDVEEEAEVEEAKGLLRRRVQSQEGYDKYVKLFKNVFKYNID